LSSRRNRRASPSSYDSDASDSDDDDRDHGRHIERMGRVREPSPLYRNPRHRDEDDSAKERGRSAQYSRTSHQPSELSSEMHRRKPEDPIAFLQGNLRRYDEMMVEIEKMRKSLNRDDENYVEDKNRLDKDMDFLKNRSAIEQQKLHFAILSARQQVAPTGMDRRLNPVRPSSHSTPQEEMGENPHGSGAVEAAPPDDLQSMDQRKLDWSKSQVSEEEFMRRQKDEELIRNIARKAEEEKQRRREEEIRKKKEKVEEQEKFLKREREWRASGSLLPLAPRRREDQLEAKHEEEAEPATEAGAAKKKGKKKKKEEVALTLSKRFIDDLWKVQNDEAEPALDEAIGNPKEARKAEEKKAKQAEFATAQTKQVMAPYASKVGLANLGNTCFFNSTIQVLLRSREFLHDLVGAYLRWKSSYAVNKDIRVIGMGEFK
jgi:hypothetical protein